MKPDDVATAITNALLQGGAKWMISTVVAFLPALWTMTLILHLGRPYVLRVLRRCGLRLGADVWWMSYLLMRDALMLLTFALSWIFFQPAIILNAAIPITAPLAALLLLLALAVKLTRRVDDDIQAFRLATVFIVLGATLYYGPLVFAVEASTQSYLGWFVTNFTSNTANPAVALTIMWVSLAGVVIVAGWLLYRLWMSASRSMAARMGTKETVPTQKPAPTVV